MEKSFREFLKTQRFILHCGSTGTELLARGGEMPGGINSILHPDWVFEIHRDYVDAGAKILLTNTFSMNSIYAATHAKGYDWQELNRRGVEISREAADGRAYVLGNLGPIGELLTPFGPLTPEDAFASYRDQAQVLLDGVVDGFSVQTFYHLEELKIAVRAIRSLTDLPIAASVVLDPHGNTMMGDSAQTAYEELLPLGIDIFGHNCGEIDPVALGDVLGPLAETAEIPLSACPNAGLPRSVDGKAVYSMTPAQFREGILYLKSKNIRILGGCCGVNLDHIKAIADLF